MAQKSVHFASQTTEHTIPCSSTTSPQQRILCIEDETQSPSLLQIPEKSMKKLQDCSKMRTDKLLTKLAKDGVIFMRAPTNNNTQRTNAIKLRNALCKLLAKYQFIEKVPHPKYNGTKQSVEQNGCIPTHVIKPKKKTLKAVYIGSVGKKEPKWRWFWEWNDNDIDNDNHDNNNNDTTTSNQPISITPESQTSLYSPPPVIKDNNNPNNKKEVTFGELTDSDKKTIFNWAVDREQCIYIKNRIIDIFTNFAKSDDSLDWKVDIVNPLWFRIQSIGSMLHADIPYILTHTNLLKQISGQKLLISGIDMINKETYIGKKSNLLKQKLSKTNDRKCPLCSYKYNDGDQEDHDNHNDDDDDDDDEEEEEEEDEEEGNHSFCENCSDSRFGIYTVWTALDYFDSPFNSGSMVFCLGSHSKYKGFYKASLNNESVPSGYSKKSISEKQNLRWGYVNDIKPGDQFIFNVKTLHGSSEAKDGFFRARIDMRVTVKPSNKRYIKELNDANIMNNNNKNNNNNKIITSHLGLSQLCSQPTQSFVNNNNNNNNKLKDTEMSPEFSTTTPIKSKHLSFEDIEDNDEERDINKSVLKRSCSTNDMENHDMAQIVNDDKLDKNANVLKLIGDHNDDNDVDQDDIDDDDVVNTENNVNNNNNDDADNNGDKEENKINDGDNLSMNTNINEDNDGNIRKISIQDLPTQANDTPDSVTNNNNNNNQQNVALRKKTLTPQDMDITNDNMDNNDNDNNNNNNDINNNNNTNNNKIESVRTVPETPVQIIPSSPSIRSNYTPQSIQSLQPTPIRQIKQQRQHQHEIQEAQNNNNNNNKNMNSMVQYTRISTVPETEYDEFNPNTLKQRRQQRQRQRHQEIIPCTQTTTDQTEEPQQTQESVLPRLEHQSPLSRQKHLIHDPHNNRYRNHNHNLVQNSRKRVFSNIDNNNNNTMTLSQSSTHQEKEKDNDNGMNIEEPPNKRQKISHNMNINKISSSISSINNMSFMIPDTKMRISNIRHFTTMNDEELCRKIAGMRNKMNRTFGQLQTQMNESLDLMEVANERYLYTKQQQNQERDRANHFQGKVENLQKKLIENHNILFKMFEQ